MINSIQYFCQEGVKKLEKVMVDYSADMTKIAEMVQGVTKSVVELGLSMIAEEWEYYDELLCSRKELRREWYIVRKDEKTLLTSLGNVTYHKTLFKNKVTGEYEYLLDRIMGMEKHTRITEDAEAKMLEEAVKTSYRRGGEKVSFSEDVVSKETVMNKVHALQFPQVEPQKERKTVKYLYIDADEDHVALQYLQEKGDIKKSRTNTIMPKLVYVYEGVKTEQGRYELICKKHFGGIYEGNKENEQLWNEVREYIEKSYDTDSLEKIYINGDGASWIRRGEKVIEKSVFVLDSFHMHKYIISATSHLLDSVEDARNELYRGIYKQKKHLVKAAFEKILMVTESETKRKQVEASQIYILGNWSGIMQKIKDKNKEIKCSAEGHISHIYADRMSSRPLGWCRIGVDKMSRLRVYEKNGGNMLELVRLQKKELPMASGCEQVICSSNKMFSAERRNREKMGAVADYPVYSIPYTQVKKIAALKNHIWGL